MLKLHPPLLFEKLEEAVARLDRTLARTLVDRLIELIRADPLCIEEQHARRILDCLRKKRFFRAMEDVARALLQCGRPFPVVRRQLCQSLIDQGKTFDAVSELNKLVQEANASGDAREVTEARGLLGRAYKQLYVDGCHAGIRPEDLQALMIRACRQYSILNAGGSTWHAINVSACLRRARSDGLPMSDFAELDENVLAREVLQEIERRETERAVDVWDFPTAAEACVVIGDAARALEWATRFTRNEQAGPFEIASFYRQLTEVWMLGGPSAPSEFNALISHLLGELLRRDPGFGELSVSAGAEHPSVSAVVGGGFEKTFQDGALVTMKWFRDAVNRCQGIARIENAVGQGWGTGFLIPKRDLLGEERSGFLMMTNSHVVCDNLDVRGQHRSLRLADGPVAVFEERGGGAPASMEIRSILWWSPPEELDYSVLELEGDVACSPAFPIAPDVPLADGTQAAWVLGHAKGGKLQASMKNNLIVDVKGPRLHYRAATEPGSSGSPVFNDAWQLIGLHHRGLTEYNEGLTIQSILDDVARKRAARPTS